MKSGAIVGNGTDAPVEDVSPHRLLLRLGHAQAEGRHRLLSRPAHEARRGAARLHLEQRLRRLRRENSKARSKRGKLADITVLSKDIMTIPDDQILATDVKYTIVGGKVMFQQ